VLRVQHLVSRLSILGVELHGLMCGEVLEDGLGRCSVVMWIFSACVPLESARNSGRASAVRLARGVGCTSGDVSGLNCFDGGE
jgi:hypothetical protein